MKALDVEYLLCGGIVSFTCPGCGENIKLTTDEVMTSEKTMDCPHCSAQIEIDEISI